MIVPSPGLSERLSSQYSSTSAIAMGSVDDSGEMLLVQESPIL